MRSLALAAVVSLGLLQATTAFANWSLGSNLGLSFMSPKDEDHVTTVGLPSGAGFCEGGLKLTRRTVGRLPEAVGRRAPISRTSG